MDKILLIVDPQVDFISGSLAVEGAKEKMDALFTLFFHFFCNIEMIIVPSSIAII